MSRILSCSRGHQWQGAEDSLATAAAPSTCPVCGATDATLAPQSEPADGATCAIVPAEAGTSGTEGTIVVEAMARLAASDRTLPLAGQASAPAEATLDRTLAISGEGSGRPAGPADATIDLQAAEAGLASAERDRTVALGDAPASGGADNGDRTVDLVQSDPEQTVAGAQPDPEGTVALEQAGPTRLRDQSDATQALGVAPPGTRSGKAAWAENDAGQASRTEFTLGEGASQQAAASGPSVTGYDILGELGRGAMGVVYKARQIGLKRTVALKMVLAGGHAGVHERARFHIEAEAVAQLQHPSIVQIYEVGEQDGCPFFSLEYLDGGTLSGKIAGKPQAPREAAKVVRTLAEAMDAAHRRGIIHRDLKPANILLSADGTPKITDFGLAKRFQEDTRQTRDGAIMGTPSYMAPEQAEGKTREVGPAADIYALGAILYDLLTGRPPFQGRTLLDTLQQVRHAEPVAPVRLQPKLPSDLGTICLKCLQKDPRKRYDSAGALAEDLRRFLAGEPIMARPVSTWERAVKWTRRRPAAAALIAVSALTALGLVVGGIALTVHERRRADDEARLKRNAEEQRDNAQRERDHAEANFHLAEEAVQKMLVRVGRQKLAYEPHMEAVRGELLEEAQHFYDRFLESRSDDPGVRKEAGLANRAVAGIQEMLGRNETAEKSYQRALALFMALADQFQGRSDYQQDVAATYFNLATLLKEVGRLPEAEKAYGEALARQQKMLDDHPLDTGYRLQLARTEYNLGMLLKDSGRSRDGEKAYRKALELFDGVAQISPAVPAYQEELARTHTGLADVLAATGRLPEAEKAIRRSIALFDGLAKRYEKIPDYQLDLAISQALLGNQLRDRDVKEAEAAYQQALTLCERLAADYPTVPSYRQQLAGDWGNLGILYQAAGRFDEADKAYDKSLAFKKRLADDFPKWPIFRRNLGVSYTTIAHQLEAQHRFDDGEKMYGQALDLFDRLATEFPDMPDYLHERARAQANLGVLYGDTRRLADAEKRLLQAVVTERDLTSRYPDVPEYKQELARDQIGLGNVFSFTSRLQDAETAYRTAAKLLTELKDKYPQVPDYRNLLALAHNDLGNLWKSTNRPSEAEQVYKEAVALYTALEKELPTVLVYHQELARSYHELGILRASQKRLEEAQHDLGEALRRQEKLMHDFPRAPAYRLELARTHSNLGQVLVQANQLPKAEEHYRQAVELLQPLPLDASVLAELVTHSTNLALLLGSNGQTKKAIAAWHEVVGLQEKLIAMSPQAPAFKTDLARNLNDLAHLLLDENQLAEARQNLENAIHQQQAALQLTRQPGDLDALGALSLELLEVLLRQEDHAAAAAAVDNTAKQMSATWPAYPRLAGCLGRCMTLAGKDPKLDEAKRKELTQTYADRAVELLQQAVDHGYKDVGYLKKTAFLDSLRSREDFKQLISKLEPPMQP